MGLTGLIDFDSIGLRRSIQLKILDLSVDGLVEMGTWSNTNRLLINQLVVRQSIAIRKHLQVVTREERPYVYRTIHSNGSISFEGYCSSD